MKQGLFYAHRHIQHWEKFPPSKRDALIILMRALHLLSNTLPIALSHIKSESLDHQEDFWRDLIALDRETDVLCMLDRTPDEQSKLQAIKNRLNEWGELAELRIKTPTGDLTEAEGGER